MKSGIYKIISPSNRVYVGKSKDIKRRFKTYERRWYCNETKSIHGSEKEYLNCKKCNENICTIEK